MRRVGEKGAGSNSLVLVAGVTSASASAAAVRVGVGVGRNRGAGARARNVWRPSALVVEVPVEAAERPVVRTLALEE